MDKLSFTKLNGSNYQTWKFKMELSLIDKDLWDTISEPRPAGPVDPANPNGPAHPTAEWLKRDGKARARIGLMVEDNQLCHIRKEASAKGAWEALQKCHEKSTLSNKIFLLKRLCRMQMPSNGDMEEHVNTLLDLVNQLEALGEELAEHLVVALLLCSLPDTYNPLITALESRNEADLTLEMVKGKLINEYKRNNGSETNYFPSNGIESAMKMSMGKAAYTKFPCHFCNKLGHFQRDCYAFKQAQRDYEKSNEEIELPKMESERAKKIVANESEIEENQLKYKCFMAKAMQSKRMNRVQNVEGWYIDSGTPSHMSNSLNFFTKIHTGTNYQVELPDGRNIFATGIGEGFIACINGKGETQRILVKNVLYVPELDTNLLSVRKLTKLGFKVNFDGDGCVICEGNAIIATGSVDVNNLYRLKVKTEVLQRSTKVTKKSINRENGDGMKSACKPKSYERKSNNKPKQTLSFGRNEWKAKYKSLSNESNQLPENTDRQSLKRTENGESNEIELETKTGNTNDDAMVRKTKERELLESKTKQMRIPKASGRKWILNESANGASIQIGKESGKEREIKSLRDLYSYIVEIERDREKEKTKRYVTETDSVGHADDDWVEEKIGVCQKQESIQLF